jgi:hypothetical protein
MRSGSEELEVLIATVVVRAHHVAICRKTMRIAEILAADQTRMRGASALVRETLAQHPANS